MKTKITARTATVKVLLRLLQQKGSLASELTLLNDLEEQDKRFAQELCYGVCRWYFYLNSTLKQLVPKPLKEKDEDIRCLLLLGMYQLQFTRVAPHAAINETVNAALYFRKEWAKKFINGVLRSFQRFQQELSQESGPEPQQEPQTAEASQSVVNNNVLIGKKDEQLSHPRWLQKAILRAWPEQADDIFVANNQHPPFTLRIHQQHNTRTEYAQALQAMTVAEDDKTEEGSHEQSLSFKETPFSEVGITLDKACDVTQLPGFSQGHVSVQDEAAQLSASLLQLEPQQHVLDACCAPGGKTCHIAEMQPNLASLTAIDLEERRLVRVRENLARLSIKANVICGDGTQPDTWWNQQLFDRILLDAPCSATGVIRRHPDIKLLRTRQAVEDLAQLQLQLLNALWPLLADGGILLYATCSVLPQENTQLIEQFINSREDVEHSVIDASWGIEQPYGRQLLPQIQGHDGFYYARLIKRTH